jgi:radical SAM protein with 4Fe4S-binding SPASM domain
MGDCACHADDLNLQWTGEGLAFAFLELTPACNNRCIGCCNVFAARRIPASLPAQAWQGLIARLATHVKWLKVSGGEPTLHPEFAEIASFIHTLELPFRLLTNGRWSEPERVLALLRPMASTITLLVSLHGPDAASHEAFSRVDGSFIEAAANVCRAAEAGLRVSTSTVLTRHNWNRVEEMVEFARSLGADHAVFNRYIGRPLPVLEATPAQVAQAIERVEALIAAGRPVRWGTPVPLCATPRATGGCLAGDAFATVDPWGNVRPCNHAPYVVGNLLAQSFEEVWHSSKMEAWRKMTPLECAGCTLYESCHGGCRAEVLLRPPSSYPLPRQPYRVEVPFSTRISGACVPV